MPIITMQQFTVLKGGKEDNPLPVYSFVEAEVTDTRLMGVLGLWVHWIRINKELDEESHIHMFFYYDIEELGLDTLSIYELYDEEHVNLAKRASFGGLGAEYISVSEKECRFLINSFVKETIRRKEELPKEVDYLAFVLDNPPELSSDEIFDLNLKMCTDLKNDYSIVHYYLMRGFGKDEEGVKLLRNQGLDESRFDDLSLQKHATFLKNQIEEFYNNDGTMSYLSESLVESERQHYICISEIKIAGGKVLEARKKKCFAVSIQEASMLLAREEYVTVYRILCPMEDFDIDFAPITVGTTRTEHENGDMFMDFKPNNNHVNDKEFRLYNDIRTLYFVSDFGELIVAAYTLEEIKLAELRIRNSTIMPDTALMVKMQLAHSVIYDFAQSDFSSFGEFIKSLE